MDLIDKSIAPAGEEERDGLPAPRRYYAMAAVWLALVMAVLDSAIANIALPTIAAEVGADPAQSVWVINAYQIAIIMLLLPLAALGEIIGYRRVFATGLIIFVVASVGCVASDSLGALTAWRFVEGVGASAIMAINGALLRLVWPHRLLSRGIGWNATIVAISAAAGPTVAAAVLSLGSWRWLFAINVPIGLAALAIGLYFLPASERSGRPFDWASGVLSAIAFGALFLAVGDVTGGHVGSRTLADLAIGLAAGFAVIWLSRRSVAPIIPLDLIRIPLLLRSYGTSVFAFAAQMIGLVALPFYLGHRFGFSHVTVGLVVTAIPIGTMVAAPLSARLLDRISAATLGAAGLILLAVAYLAVAGLSSAALIAACMWIVGFGFGLMQTPNNRVMLGEAPWRRSGAAAGMLAMSRLTGQTLGAIVTALCLRMWGTSSVAPFLVAAAFGLVSAAFSATRRGRTAG
ncbi:MFS transporter [Acuticoccus sediminis]|uniref:MFS transporter n=1 Tax=Acuticoccus sediminis TaxID=2184697 RepID=UPI001CFE2176|nr:MFS transporter [Acuticoccus sediminis]